MLEKENEEKSGAYTILFFFPFEGSACLRYDDDVSCQFTMCMCSVFFLLRKQIQSIKDKIYVYI